VRDADWVVSGGRPRSPGAPARALNASSPEGGHLDTRTSHGECRSALLSVGTAMGTLSAPAPRRPFRLGRLGSVSSAPRPVEESVLNDLKGRLRDFRRVPLVEGVGWDRGTDPGSLAAGRLLGGDLQLARERGADPRLSLGADRGRRHGPAVDPPGRRRRRADGGAAARLAGLVSALRARAAAAHRLERSCPGSGEANRHFISYCREQHVGLHPGTNRR